MCPILGGKYLAALHIPRLSGSKIGHLQYHEENGTKGILNLPMFPYGNIFFQITIEGVGFIFLSSERLYLYNIWYREWFLPISFSFAMLRGSCGTLQIGRQKWRKRPLLNFICIHHTTCCGKNPSVFGSLCDIASLLSKYLSKIMNSVV